MSPPPKFSPEQFGKVLDVPGSETLMAISGGALGILLVFCVRCRSEIPLPPEPMPSPHPRTRRRDLPDPAEPLPAWWLDYVANFPHDPRCLVPLAQAAEAARGP